MIRAAWCSAKPRARFQVPSSTSRAAAKHSSPGPAEHAPGGDHISGRITDSDPAEVDDRAQPAIANQQVGPQQVGVDPHRRPVPGRCLEGALPGGGGGIAVDDAPRRVDRRARDGVELAQWPAPAARCPDDGGDSAQLEPRTGQDPWPPGVHRQPAHPRTAGRRSIGRSPTRRGTSSSGGPCRPARGSAATAVARAWGASATPCPGPVPRPARAAAARRGGRQAGRWRSPSPSTAPHGSAGRPAGGTGRPPTGRQARVDVDLPVMHLHPGRSTPSLLVARIHRLLRELPGEQATRERDVGSILSAATGGVHRRHRRRPALNAATRIRRQGGRGGVEVHRRAGPHEGEAGDQVIVVVEVRGGPSAAQPRCRSQTGCVESESLRAWNGSRTRRGGSHGPSLNCPGFIGGSVA